MSLSQEEIDALLRGQGEAEREQQTRESEELNLAVLETYAETWSDALAQQVQDLCQEPLVTSAQEIAPLTEERVQQILTEDFLLLDVPSQGLCKSPLIFLVSNPSLCFLAEKASAAELNGKLTESEYAVVQSVWDTAVKDWHERLAKRYGLKLESSPTTLIDPGDTDSNSLLENVVSPAGLVEMSIQSPSEMQGKVYAVFGKDVIDALEPLEISRGDTNGDNVKSSRPAGPKAEESGAFQGGSAEKPGPKPKPVVFESLVAETEHAEPSNLDLIMDISMEIRVELGRKQYRVQEILGLAAGSVVELNKLAGEPVDLLVNDKLFARGEVVVIDENFGVRVTEIVSLKERIESLR